MSRPKTDYLSHLHKNKKIKKIKRAIAGLLIAVSLGNYLDYLPTEIFAVPQVKAAQEEEENELKNNELALIAILVEEGLMGDLNLRTRIMTYAKNAQSRISHSKAFVIEVDKNESTFKIASMLEKLYYEGIDKDQIDANPLNNDSISEDDNQLAGIVMIGDVPLPVVHEDGNTLPSVYPYTDFYRKAYIYNHATDQFEKNDQVSTPTPEIWHGLINPPSKDPVEGKKELMEYFEKNNDFSNEEKGFANFEKRVLYANFLEMEKQMNWMDYKAYERYNMFMEEMVFKRFNKGLLKVFIDRVSEDMGSPVPLMDNNTINNLSDSQMEPIFKNHTRSFAQSLNFYRSGINESIQKTGRWSPGEVDTPESLIDLRDTYAKKDLHRKQLMLEKEVNDFVEDNVPKAERELDVISDAKFKVTLEILEANVDERTFDFFSHIEGVPVQTMESAAQCGIQIGQKKPDNQSVMENNSVLVNANRLYNIETTIKPPDDPKWKLEEDAQYKKYAGCVFNNSMKIEQSGTDPLKCNPNDAEASLFDVKGSIEVKANEPVYSDAVRCSIDRMSFLLSNQDQFSSIAAGGEVGDIKIGQSLEEVINETYLGLKGNLQSPSLKQKGTFVMKKMIATGQPYSYKPLVGVKITVEVEPVEKKLNSMYPHVEPKNETLKSINHFGVPRVDEVTGEVKLPQITNPSQAADGIRYLSFFQKGLEKSFEYLNLFRIEGNNSEAITQNLLAQIKQKQKELDDETELKGSTFENFFVENSEIIEPLTWRASSIDQKLSEIIPKYMDRDSFMPTPFYNPKKSPNNKPEGYEVLHIVADGDAQGFEFGLDRAIRAQEVGVTEVNPPPPDEEKDPNDNPNPDDNDPNDDPDDNEGNYVCGDPTGVEIWEWFDALQCWIDEEILPAQDLFSLSQTCTVAPLPPKETQEEKEDVFDEILAKASKFTVEMNRKSLVIGQPAPITISAFNNLNEPLLGYIDMPVHLELSDPSLGEFSDNDFYLFTGMREMEFTPKKTGSTQLTIKMGDLQPQNFTLHVYEKINLEWVAKEQIKNGRSEFALTVQAKTPDNNTITDIDDEILLAPEQPADGGFSNNGKVKLIKGKGETIFIPTPGKKKISLVSKDLYVTGKPFVISPTAAPASQIVLKTEKEAVIGKEMNIEVIATDAFGVPAANFNGDIEVAIDEATKDYGTLKQKIVKIKNGKGVVALQAGKNSGEVKIKAQHKNLKSGEINIPILARIEAEDWKETYPQNLFASFVGFPAGDYSQENYFGGVHLMSGKTEAVYSFLAAPKAEPSIIVHPNHSILLSNAGQSVFVEFLNNQILLQAFDEKKMQTLLSKKVTLNFQGVDELNSSNLEKNKMYVDILDSNYSTKKTDLGIDIQNQIGEKIAQLEKNKVHILDNTFRWQYVSDSEFGAVELNLTDGLVVAARIILNFANEKIEIENFEEINPSLNSSRLYGGKSVNDPTGLYFFEKGAEVADEEREEFYGIEGDHNYLSLFASGVNIGEAMKFNLPTTGILLGDPTIKLKTKSSSSLNYNAASGEKIYQDSEGAQVVSINHFNFNNDGQDDVAVLLDDGRVRLLEGGATEPPYKDRGNIALLADGGVALETLDLKKDGYEDLLVATAEGRLAILNNEKEVIRRTDLKINIGKRLKKLLRDDMDQDGYDDLVVLDSRGDIYIFYYNPKNKSFPENGQLIGNYGFSLKLDTNLAADLDMRYANILEPKGIDDGANQSKETLDKYEGGGNIDPKDALEYIEKLQKETDEAAENPEAMGQNEVPKLPWPEGNEIETYFAPIESVLGIVANKKLINKDRPEAKNLDLEETLLYTVEVSSGGTFNQVVLADSLPDSLSFDPQTVKCVQGDCQEIKVLQNGVKLFFNNLKLTSGKKIIFTYEAKVQHTPDADMILDVIKEPNENLNNPNAIIDKYTDILVSPPFNNTGKLLIHYTTGAKSYALTQSNEPKSAPADESINDFKDLMSQMQDLENGQFDEDNPPPPIKMPGMGEALDEATGNNDCYEDPENTASCAEEALDEAAEAIGDFGCMGGGCFPMPFNKAFLVPPSLAMPVFAFPTTLPTPVGPMPFVWPGSFIGAASIPGPIFSALRFYISPTLTGGIGMAMCWGPYPMAPSVPPPVFPIPYPPPIGNCMVTALPVDKIYGGLCSDIENGIEKLMALISSGVNKVEATINGASNDPNIPVNIQPTGPGQGTGGLEISLAINLGKANKFDPPVQSFSNIHLPSFDSLQGVISGWFDRQLLEIKNKLLTLPTFSVYLPDFKSLFTLDADKTQKQFEGWYNTMDGSGAATLNSLKSISEQDQVDQKEGGLTAGQEIRGGLAELSASNALGYKNAIEKQASIYNLNALEGLYDVASTLPLVKLTQKPIEFRVPWLSAAQIQNYIIQLQNWIIYYEQEYDRVKDKWEALKCDDKPDTTDATSLRKNATECAGRKLADAFETTFDENIESAKKNIEVLQSYLAFPKQLASYKTQLAGYVGSISCYIDIIAQMMGGYMATLQQQMVAWAEMILTISEVVKNIKDLFNVFTSFDSTCDTCMNERYANFGWWSLLGLLLPEIPVIQFPKIPDIVLDLSNIDLMMDVELPVLNIRPEPIPLPPLPYVSLPDLPNVNIFLQMPALPILPALPQFPPLPDLPPLPVVDLPTLPPPPKLPDVGKGFEAILPLIEKILQTWCIMKKSFAPIPEQALSSQITLLTNRPAYLTPLDLLKVELPKIAPFDLGFNEVRIQTMIYLGLKINMISRPLEEIANTWDTWVKAIPDSMNAAYQQYLEVTETKVQGALDEADQYLEEKGLAFEQSFDKYVQQQLDKYVQGWLDENIGDPLEEGEKWLQNKIDVWNEWAIENKVNSTYQDYSKAINNLYEKTRKLKNEGVNEWFDKNRDWIHALNYLIPTAFIFEIANEQNLGNHLEEALDLVAEKLNEFESLGPTLLPRLYTCLRFYEDCRENEEKYFGLKNDGDTSVETEKIEEPVQMVAQAQLPVTHPTPDAPDMEQMLKSGEGQQIKGLIGEMSNVINGINQGEMVDYTVLKEKFGVQDYLMKPRNTTVDKLKRMNEELNKHSENLLAEAHGLKYIQDLNALAGVAEQEILPFALASNQNKEVEQKETVYTNILDLPEQKIKLPENDLEKEVVELKEKIKGEYGNHDQIVEPVLNNTSCKAAVCLPDPNVNALVPVIPFINLAAKSEILFMPKGHLIYSDGTGIYLKRDLTVDEKEDNMDNGNPQRFSMSDIMSKIRMPENPKEAVNMLQTVFTEEGAATFNWQPTSHPEVYGYGLEMKKQATGYKRSKKAMALDEVKIILLPTNEDGLTPEVYAGETKIEYGTLVTSLTDKVEISEKFGLRPGKVVTNKDEINFPTINNAQINLSDHAAVYFDKLQGSAYSLEMENQYQQIRMTWFDKNAGTSTYNKNEILAPQIYAGTTEPVDLGQSTYYVPIYKEKEIKATDLFADLGGGYKYYWYIDPDKNKLSPVVGGTLILGPRKEVKKIKIKLVATQDILDPSFERFEKTFVVQVYAPEINLNQEQLDQGIIAGEMKAPAVAGEDDLSSIPLSVFRKRAGTWKNLGILHDKAENKTPTTPPLNDHEGKPHVYSDSYYSVGSRGGYEIKGFDILNPSPILIKDQQGKTVAEVMPGNGKIQLYDNQYDLLAVPASVNSPTHIAIVLKKNSTILANIYYVAENTVNVTIVNEGLTAGNVAPKGVTAGDLNLTDSIVATNLPKEAPSFGGGVAIFEQNTEKNIAMVDTDGSIRIMDAGFELGIKNKNSQDKGYVFQLLNGKQPVFDFFIQTDWDNLEMDASTKMDTLEKQIGFQSDFEKVFAPLIPQVSQEALKPAATEQSPFPDVPATHPFFQEILDLYKLNVVDGYEDGSFKPDQKLTRAEFVKIAFGAANCYDCEDPVEAEKKKYNGNPFPDVSLPAWYYYCIWMAKQLGMITGYGDGLFRPDKNISRAEAVSVLLRQSKAELSKAPVAGFSDVKPDAWYVDYVYTALEIGLVKTVNGLIKPDEEISRGEFAFMAAGLKNFKQCVPICPCEGNPNQTDTDKDGIPDKCDADLDGDGSLNPICIFNPLGELDPKLIDEGVATLDRPVDNCIFVPNPNQDDYNQNGTGDMCEACACSNNPNQNDTDKDGLPDKCDMDIDNDTVNNPICIFDGSGLLDKDKLVGKVDNCIFDPNNTQEDLNNNGIGDICEASDLCPGIPEDIDGVLDGDGCPEVTDDFGEKESGIYVGPGPLCSLLDYSSDLMPGDTFMTGITDLKTHDIIYSKSKELIYKK